jgi:hypothetical protein
MKLRLILIFWGFAVAAFGQNNIKKTAGINYTDGVPTIAVGEKTGSEIAIDTATGYIYQWHRTAGPSEAGTWKRVGQGIDIISGSSAPSYAPFRNQSWFVINASNALYKYSGSGTTWTLLNGGGGGGGGTVVTDATLTGDGSLGTPLGIAQQSASTSEVLQWTGAAWEPSWGNPTIFVTTGQTITTAVNEILIGTIGASITLGLPTCDATNDMKHFKFVRNGADAFSVTIDPSGTQTFYDGTSTKTQYGKLSIDCTCRFSGGTGVWFFDNF